MVRKHRTESQSLSLGEPTEDATYARDELPSLEEPPPTIKNPLTGARKKLAPLKITSPKHESVQLIKQSEAEEKIESIFNKHPRSLLDNNTSELKITGGGSMFLKCNTKKNTNSEEAEIGLPPRGILRERNSLLEASRSLELEKISPDKSDKDDDDKKSVRFNLENTTDVAFTFSDKSSDDDDDEDHDRKSFDDNMFNVKITPNKSKSKSRFTITRVGDSGESSAALKLIKPNPGDFIKPKLTISKGSDSEDDSDDNNSDYPVQTKKLEEKAEKRIARLKQNIWEEKNDELVKFRDDLQESHKDELERILITVKTEHENKIKTELENIRIEMENRNSGTLKDERLKLEAQLLENTTKLQQEFEDEQNKLKAAFDNKKEELEKYYEEKLADIEKDLAERMEKNRDELIFNHTSNIEQLKQNHSIILEDLKRGFQAEEDVIRKEHKAVIADLKQKIHESSKISGKDNAEDAKQYDKIRCEKRLLEDKYRCLKEKYLRLKTEVKILIEKRNKKKEQGGTTTTTTGSETERSNSNNKDRSVERIFSRLNPALKCFH